MLIEGMIDWINWLIVDQLATLVQAQAAFHASAGSGLPTIKGRGVVREILRGFLDRGFALILGVFFCILGFYNIW